MQRGVQDVAKFSGQPGPSSVRFYGLPAFSKFPDDRNANPRTGTPREKRRLSIPRDATFNRRDATRRDASWHEGNTDCEAGNARVPEAREYAAPMPPARYRVTRTAKYPTDRPYQRYPMSLRRYLLRLVVGTPSATIRRRAAKRIFFPLFPFTLVPEFQFFVASRCSSRTIRHGPRKLSVSAVAYETDATETARSLSRTYGTYRDSYSGATLVPADDTASYFIDVRIEDPLVETNEKEPPAVKVFYVERAAKKTFQSFDARSSIPRYLDTSIPRKSRGRRANKNFRSKKTTRRFGRRYSNERASPRTLATIIDLRTDRPSSPVRNCDRSRTEEKIPRKTERCKGKKLELREKKGNDAVEPSRQECARVSKEQMAHGRPTDTKFREDSTSRVPRDRFIVLAVEPRPDNFSPNRRPTLVLDRDHRSALSAEGGGARACEATKRPGGCTSLPGTITQQPLIYSRR
ncbi:uncharacterized protein LOC143147887 [Ptiloglossa arizonensis]|uniref:uncharacterized protein LOC143147887 n=1 Tax=Ptiloglossa arizonensis TaxID=3350558 RepID=UPI003FA0F692